MTKKLQEKHAVVKEARGRGLLLALEFHPHDHLNAESAFRALLAEGFLVGYYPAGNILRFDPCLTVEKTELNRLVACLDRYLGSIGA